METQSSRTWIAGLLIAVGVLVLLERLEWLGGHPSWLWGVAFLAGGAAFIAVYLNDRSQWWALFPGFGLVGLAAAALLGSSGGALLLALLGLAFALVYASNRRRWWAIIPAGSLATLALMAWLATRWPAADLGWLFFLGLAATFAALAIQPPERRQRWAVLPALGLAALSLVTLVSSRTGPVVVAVLAILAGAAMLARNGRPSLEAPRRGRRPS